VTNSGRGLGNLLASTAELSQPSGGTICSRTHGSAGNGWEEAYVLVFAMKKQLELGERLHRRRLLNDLGPDPSISRDRVSTASCQLV
jgi:hypothetical protein